MINLLVYALLEHVHFWERHRLLESLFFVLIGFEFTFCLIMACFAVWLAWGR